MRDRWGQYITFASVIDPDANYNKYVYVTAKKDDTIAKIVARRGRPDLKYEVARLNGIRNPYHVLKEGRRIKLPGTVRQQFAFDVRCDDKPPKVTRGYAKMAIQARPARTGVNQFDGYDPLGMDLSIVFDNFLEDARQHANSGTFTTGIEDDIAKLERMAGRGDYGGAASGPPAVIRVASTDANGNVVPLIPMNFQWSGALPTGITWRVENIQWDDNPDRNGAGYRVRQKAVVSIGQFTPITLVNESVAKRKSKPKGLVTVGPWGEVTKNF